MSSDLLAADPPMPSAEDEDELEALRAAALSSMQMRRAKEEEARRRASYIVQRDTRKPNLLAIIPLEAPKPPLPKPKSMERSVDPSQAKDVEIREGNEDKRSRSASNDKFSRFSHRDRSPSVSSSSSSEEEYSSYVTDDDQGDAGEEKTKIKAPRASANEEVADEDDVLRLNVHDDADEFAEFFESENKEKKEPQKRRKRVIKRRKKVKKQLPVQDQEEKRVVMRDEIQFTRRITSTPPRREYTPPHMRPRNWSPRRRVSPFGRRSPPRFSRSPKRYSRSPVRQRSRSPRRFSPPRRRRSRSPASMFSRKEVSDNARDRKSNLIREELEMKSQSLPPSKPPVKDLAPKKSKAEEDMKKKKIEEEKFQEQLKAASPEERQRLMARKAKFATSSTVVVVATDRKVISLKKDGQKEMEGKTQENETKEDEGKTKRKRADLREVIAPRVKDGAQGKGSVDLRMQLHRKRDQARPSDEKFHTADEDTADSLEAATLSDEEEDLQQDKKKPRLVFRNQEETRVVKRVDNDLAVGDRTTKKTSPMEKRSVLDRLGDPVLRRKSAEQTADVEKPLFDKESEATDQKETVAIQKEKSSSKKEKPLKVKSSSKKDESPKKDSSPKKEDKSKIKVAKKKKKKEKKGDKKAKRKSKKNKKERDSVSSSSSEEEDRRKKSDKKKRSNDKDDDDDDLFSFFDSSKSKPKKRKSSGSKDVLEELNEFESKYLGGKRKSK